MKYSDAVNEGKLGSFSAYVIALTEDHEKVMSESEMTAFISKLFKKATDEQRPQFLKALATASDAKDCAQADIPACAKKLCAGDKKKCDSLIHKLENIVGYKLRIK